MGKERLVLSSWEAALTRFVESSGMIFSPFLASASPEKQFQDSPNGGVQRGTSPRGLGEPTASFSSPVSLGKGEGHTGGEGFRNDFESIEPTRKGGLGDGRTGVSAPCESQCVKETPSPQ